MKPRQPSRVHGGKRWQFHQAPRRWPGRCGEGHPPEPPPHNPGGGFIQMPADALKCKECADRPTRSRRATSASAASARSRSPTTPRDARRAEALKRRIQAGPHSHLALRRLPAARARPPRARAARPAGRRWCAPTGSPSGSGSARCGSRTTPPTRRTRSRTASSSVALARARELGFDDVACASTGNLANAVAAHAAAAGLRVLRVHPGRPRGAEDPRHRRLRRATSSPSSGNYDDVNRLCTELVGRARAGRSSTSTCARTTPRAPRRSRSRPPSSSAGSCPTASSRRSPPARCSPRSPAASRSGIDARAARAATCRR